jgi:hypothetical protein
MNFQRRLATGFRSILDITLNFQVIFNVLLCQVTIAKYYQPLSILCAWAPRPRGKKMGDKDNEAGLFDIDDFCPTSTMNFQQP